MNKDIRVSVAMTSYNGEKFISEQIESILRNLSIYDELIISDDGSTDKTLIIINDYIEKDHRITLLHGPQKGVVSNFEYCIKHCRGKYIFLSDQDDIWYDNKVSIVLPLLKDSILVCHNANIFDQESKKVIGTTQKKIGCHRTIFSNIIKNSFIGCCMAFRHELTNYILPFPDKKNIFIHDWWIGLVALKNGKVCFIKKTLIEYRIHQENSLGFHQTSICFKIKKRVRMIITLRRKRII